MDSSILYGDSKSQPLPYEEIKIEKDIRLNEILNTPDDNDIGYFSEVDLSYPYNIKQKTKHFLFCPGNKCISKEKFSDYMKRFKPKKYISHNKLICHWTDKKKCLIH